MHIDPHALSSSLDEIGFGETDAVSVDDSLARVVSAAQDLFAITGVGVMLADETGAQRYVLGTDAAAGALERGQEALGEGPCIDCFVLGRPARTRDLLDDDRWPRLRVELRGSGVRAVLGVPIRVGGLPVGSFNVYRETAFDWDDSDVEAVDRYNEIVESTLTAAVARRRGERIVRQLQDALDRRVVIERAVGLLMARNGSDAVSAFNLLRASARDARRTVADVSEEVLGGGELTAASRTSVSGG